MTSWGQKHFNQSQLKRILFIDQVYSNTRVPTQVNTSQHESETSLTQVNTSPTLVNTNQHESKTGPR